MLYVMFVSSHGTCSVTLCAGCGGRGLVHPFSGTDWSPIYGYKQSRVAASCEWATRQPRGKPSLKHFNPWYANKMVCAMLHQLLQLQDCSHNHLWNQNCATSACCPAAQAVQTTGCHSQCLPHSPAQQAYNLSKTTWPTWWCLGCTTVLSMILATTLDTSC